VLYFAALVVFAQVQTHAIA